MAFDNVPACLRSLRQWVCWRSENRNGDKPTKIPVTIAGYDASSTSPSDWYTFENVCQHSRKFAGIGFVFTDSDQYVGIDVDDCFASPGELKPWAVPIVEALQGTYAEVSPSGNGIKFFTIGPQLDKGRRVDVGDGKIEIYSSGRFFTVTGRVWNDCDCCDIGAANRSLINSYFPPEFEPPSVLRRPLAVDDRVERAAKYLETMDPSISGSGGHDACFRAACKMVMGFDLDTETAYSLLANGYNARCVPPWSEKELRHKVKQADKQSGDRGYLLTEPARVDHYPGVDLSGILGAKCRIQDDGTLPDDETFFSSMIPNDGLMREIYDYYRATAYKSTPTIGLAVAVSIMSTILGRRVQSHTELRTNDYHIVIAGTSSGKESCEGTTLKILDAAIKNAVMPQGFRMIVPPDVQSGNALLRELSEIKCALWICDEFGKHLQVILDKKQNGNHAAMIGTHLLKIYGKGNQTYHGAAHSAGNKGTVEQPHLCLLGMTTGSVFNSIGVSQIEDGLFGRLSWWPVPKRPERSKTAKPQPVPFELAAQLGLWIKWQPGFQGIYPDPATIDMDDQSKARWEHHADMIDRRMQDEAEIRAAVWGRVAARAMKLALVHRCARFSGDPAALENEPITIEMIDVEWGIKLANWLAKIACELVAENVADPNQNRLRSLIMAALADGEKPQEWFTRKFRKFTSGDIQASAAELEGDGLIEIREESTGGRPKRIYSMQKTP
jgi:hypothetical protein